jgi:hypothetical protein
MKGKHSNVSLAALSFQDTYGVSVQRPVLLGIHTFLFGNKLGLGQTRPSRLDGMLILQVLVLIPFLVASTLISSSMTCRHRKLFLSVVVSKTCHFSQCSLRRRNTLMLALF